MTGKYDQAQEVAAALAVKWLKMLVKQTERDSTGDPWRVLNKKLAEFDPIADAILGVQTWDILDRSEYLATGGLPLKEVLCT
jgi:hypothetical protein